MTFDVNTSRAASCFKHRRALPLLTAALACLLLAAPLCSHAAEPSAAATFQPPGMWIWDNWFAREGNQWHAFYLQLPKAVGPERRWKGNDLYKHVGHAVSANLFDWQDAGSALCALSGTWNDRHIATGSIIRHEDKWWMFFTGRGTAGDGVGLALSTDLMTWKTEPQPVFPLSDTFAKDGPGPADSTWQGRPQRWVGISDPYIYPEAVDGWFYIVLCSRILAVPIESSGCLTLIRSRDLRQWESAGIVSWPQCFERMETPQLWRHQGRWYLSFGGVLSTPWAQAQTQQQAFPPPVRGQRSHQNYYFMLSDFRQPAQVADLHYITIPADSYIMKVLSVDEGHDVALFTSKEKEPRGSSLSPPYAVRYAPSGEFEIEPLARPAKAP